MNLNSTLKISTVTAVLFVFSTLASIYSMMNRDETLANMSLITFVLVIVGLFYLFVKTFDLKNQ